MPLIYDPVVRILHTLDFRKGQALWKRLALTISRVFGKEAMIHKSLEFLQLRPTRKLHGSIPPVATYFRLNGVKPLGRFRGTRCLENERISVFNVAIRLGAFTWLEL